MNTGSKLVRGSLLLAFGAALAAACGGSGTTKPEAMSAAAHRGEADKHAAGAQPDLQLAREHAAAARELEQYVEAECSKFDPWVRTECPLMHVVVAVEDVPGGARLKLRDGTSVEAVLDHMRCHQAFGGEHAFSGMPRCPLYVGGVEFRAEEPGAIVIASSDQSITGEIRDRARLHLPGAAKSPARTYSPWSSGYSPGSPSLSLPGN